jgi:CelD/BcsL family acetyltransferase involved in cellulose biosynthesis
MYYWIDPTNDKRWAEFILRHPSASVFHTPEWLKALDRTYGFTPLTLTTSAPGAEITNGIPFCRVRSIITGRRLVSLPFSDHCEPLSAPEELLEALPSIFDEQRIRYLELRPLAAPSPSSLSCSERYWFHVLDLSPALDDIYRKFHPDCVRRKIRRAEREGLETEEGRSEKLLDEFYALQVLTRRRHGLPPQPRKWFRNLLDALGEKSEIRVARFEGRAVAAILTLRHNRTAVYKYGCSAAEDNKRGGMQLLFWQHIQDAKKRGMEAMDLGRCDVGDLGLAEFKERWGAERKEIAYYRYPARQTQPSRKLAFLSKLPNPVLVAAGRLLYRHMG